MLGELGISPDVSDDIEDDGDGGGGSSSWNDVETGVLRSQEAMPVRRRFEGGMLDVGVETPCLVSSRSETSASAREERGEPGESAIGMGGCCGRANERIDRAKAGTARQ